MPPDEGTAGKSAPKLTAVLQPYQAASRNELTCCSLREVGTNGLVCLETGWLSSPRRPLAERPTGLFKHCSHVSKSPSRHSTFTCREQQLDHCRSVILQLTTTGMSRRDTHQEVNNVSVREVLLSCDASCRAQIVWLGRAVRDQTGYCGVKHVICHIVSQEL